MRQLVFEFESFANIVTFLRQNRVDSYVEFAFASVECSLARYAKASVLLCLPDITNERVDSSISPETMNTSPLSLHRLVLARSQSGAAQSAGKTGARINTDSLTRPATRVTVKDRFRCVTTAIQSTFDASEYSSRVASAITRETRNDIGNATIPYTDTGSPTDPLPSDHEHKEGCGIARCQGACKGIECKLSGPFAVKAVNEISYS